MRTDRREFLQLSLAAGAVFAANARAQAATQEKRPAADMLKILILGGTGFIGPALVPLATARGHQVTLFNRGKTNKELFPELEKLQGDRDPKKGEGIKALEGRKWDIVFDDCGYYPRMVTASAEMLAKGGLGHYVYVSSISCYAKMDQVGADEASELATMPDPTVESMGPGYAYYGPLKALCEQAAERAMPKKTTIIRPGYIVGPGDPTDRFTYWPVRFERGGAILVPGTPTDPLQVIDVRDLAAFMLRVAENRVIDTFNCCGPEKPAPWGDVIAACAAASSAKDIAPRWVPTAKVKELSEKHKALAEAQWIWERYEDDTRGTHTVSNERAKKAGLTFRPIGTICKDTLAWWKTLPEERRSKMRGGLPADVEAEILKSLG